MGLYHKTFVSDFSPLKGGNWSFGEPILFNYTGAVTRDYISMYRINSPIAESSTTGRVTYSWFPTTPSGVATISAGILPGIYDAYWMKSGEIFVGGPVQVAVSPPSVC